MVEEGRYIPSTAISVQCARVGHPGRSLLASSSITTKSEIATSVLPAAHLPEDFVRRLRSAFDEAAVEQILNSMSAPKRQAYWVNPLKVDVRESPGASMPGASVAGAAGVYVVGLEDRDLVTQSEEARDGRVYPINPSSTLAIDSGRRSNSSK